MNGRVHNVISQAVWVGGAASMGERTKSKEGRRVCMSRAWSSGLSSAKLKAPQSRHRTGAGPPENSMGERSSNPIATL